MQVYHFHNGMGGGVLSVIKNLLAAGASNPHIESHIIYTINKDVILSYTSVPLKGALSKQVFHYDPVQNFYHTCQQLQQMLPGDDAVIVAHDWLELGMASNLGLQNPVVQVVHGDHDYYYELASMHSRAIDQFIAVSPLIEKKLLERLPDRKDDISYLKFPVPAYAIQRKESESVLRIIFYTGDLFDDNKQLSVVSRIAELLQDDPGNYFFTIAGPGMSKEAFYEVWPPAMKERVNFVGASSHEAIIDLLQEQDIFILPSKAEGLPVSLIESMKCGVVPLVSKWNGAADELVIEGVTGFQFDIGDAGNYAACLKQLSRDRQQLQNLSANCMQKANEMFDPVKNTAAYHAVFKRAAEKRSVKKPVKVYGSRLDKNWMPDILVRSIRKYTLKRKNP